MFQIKNCLRLILSKNQNVAKSCKYLLKNEQNSKVNVIKKLYYSKDTDNDKNEEEIFEEIIEEDMQFRNPKRKPVVSGGVKLYPGFQDSVEDTDRRKFENEKQELDAKGLIEEFYGLNELEYEDANDADENDDVISGVKRDESNNATLHVESAVNVLKRENVEDICCIKIPDYLNYANFMIIGTCKSPKHMRSCAVNFNKVYKLFKQDDDLYVKQSGLESTKWCAIDAGNFVLHLFTPEYRGFYDLESLWTTGAKYDDQYNDFLSKEEELKKQLDYVESVTVQKVENNNV